MAFLVWNNEDDADDSLAAINAMYGLPFEAENGYKMDQWDVVKESETTSSAGFYKPEERLGQIMDDLMPALTSGFTEHAEIPEEFIPEEEEEIEIAEVEDELKISSVSNDGLVLWLDADDADTIIETDSAGKVSQWNDKSGNDNHVTQVEGVNQPGTGAETINGKNTIHFNNWGDGSGGALNGNQENIQIPLSDHTILLVVNFRDWSGSVLSWTSWGTWEREVFEPQGTGLIAKSYNVTGTVGHKILIDGDISNQDSLIRISVESGNNMITSLNGVMKTSHSILAVPNVDRFVIGANTTLTPDGEDINLNYVNAKIGELLIYNRILSVGEVANVESYLADKWGITLEQGV